MQLLLVNGVLASTHQVSIIVVRGDRPKRCFPCFIATYYTALLFAI